MKELKKHLSLTEQVALLESRGLVIADKQAAEELLYHVNYYRLSGYLHGFKQEDKAHYLSGTTLEQRGRPTRVCRMAGRAGSSHHQQRKTERSRRGTPCCTYRCCLWLLAGCVRVGAPCFSV